jgi:outer membrane lipoprotein-sorting protein
MSFRSSSIVLLLTMGLLTAPVAHAATSSEARSTLEQWMKAASKVRTVQAEFDQVRMLSTVRVPLKRPGKVWMDSGSGLFKWQINEPATMTVVKDKSGKLTVLDVKEKKARTWTKEALMNEEQQGRGQGFAMLQSMQSPTMEDFEKRFEIKDGNPSAENASVWTFDLALKDRQASVAVRLVQMTVDISKGTLVSLVITMRDKSSMGTYVRSSQINQTIPASVFQLDMQGYEVEENR